MDNTTMIIDLLKLHFGWHRARITCLAYLIIALFKVKTVNLAEVATAFPDTADMASHYKRIQRVLKQVDIKPQAMATFVVSCVPHDTYTLSIDRTNWMFGCCSMNFLVLSVIHEGVAFPVFWLFLRTQGNSHTTERIALLDTFIDTFGAEKIDS